MANYELEEPNGLVHYFKAHQNATRYETFRKNWPTGVRGPSSRLTRLEDGAQWDFHREEWLEDSPVD